MGRRLLLTAALILLSNFRAEAQWTNIGPFGGETPVLVADASGTNVYALSRRTGVFRSTARGSWILVFDAVARGVTPTRMTVDPQTSRVYVGTSSGLFRSDDVGATWKALPTDPIIDVAASGDRLIISTPRGLLRSGDAGENVIAIDSPSDSLDIPVTMIRVDPKIVERFASIAGSSLFLSGDLGNTWDKLNATNVRTATFGDVLYAGGPDGVFICESDCTRVLNDPVMDVAYWRSILYAAISDGVLVFAPPWQRLISGFPNAAPLTLLATPQTLFVATTAGIYVTEDGQQWTERNDGLTNVRVIGMAIAGGSLFAATQGQSVMRRNGTTWTITGPGLPSNPPITLPARVLASDGVTLYAGFLGDGLFRSTNLGATWDSITSGLPSRDVLDVAGDAGTVIVATGGGVVHSTDRGSTWKNYPAFPGLVGTSVAIQGTRVAIGSATNVYFSSDSGVNWETKELPATVLKIAIAGSRVIVGTDPGLFVRTNSGWSGPFLGARVNVLAAAGARAFAATIAGVFVSDDGVTWIQIPGSNGLPKDINALASDGAVVYAGANGGSIFSSPVFTRRRTANH